MVQHINVSSVASVECLGEFEDEYVYDIGVGSGQPWFFANSILVHNSCYFSAYEAWKDKPEFADFDWTDRDAVIELYDAVAEQANASFPEFMDRTFNTGTERGAKIKAGRELVASMGLFIKKKKYALLMYEYDGDRYDQDGKPGKLKVMGLDLKRADTPKYMQKFLERMLMDLLQGVPRQTLYEQVKQFRREFKDKPAWEKGTPKAVKALTDFANRLRASHRRGIVDDGVDINLGKVPKKRPKQASAKVNVPGHVRASLNWNDLCDLHGDKHAMRITDGSKVIVCKLKKNMFNMDSVAYPIDEPHLPEWFRKLPFDVEAMEETIIDNKLLNLVGVLDWDLNATKDRLGDDLFVFANG